MEKISLSQNGDVTVVTFSQPKFLDDGDIQQLGDELFQVVDSGVEKILLDMSTVGFLSSAALNRFIICLLYTSPSPRDATLSRMPSSA